VKVTFEHSASEYFIRESSYSVELTIPESLHTIRVLPTRSGSHIHTIELWGKKRSSTTGDHEMYKGRWRYFGIKAGKEFPCGIKGKYWSYKGYKYILSLDVVLCKLD